MALILSCFIEKIVEFHPNMELEHLIFAAVSLMRRYSQSPCDFTLECKQIVSNLLEGVNEPHIQVYWQNVTQPRAMRIAQTHQQKDLVEFAAIAITCILFPKVVNSGLEATAVGDRADYWTRGKQYLVEISGTENTKELRRRYHRKIKQLLSNPYEKPGYVVVCGFSNQRILFSFHTQEEVKFMSPHQLPSSPYPEELQRLINNKSSVLFRARQEESQGRHKESMILFHEAAQKEEQIAQFLETSGYPEDATINWISAASCYMKAAQYLSARNIFEQVLSKAMPGGLRNEVQRLKVKCEMSLKKLERKRRKVQAEGV